MPEHGVRVVVVGGGIGGLSAAIRLAGAGHQVTVVERNDVVGGQVATFERDGDTVSAERDVSVVDLTRKISAQDLLARLDKQLAEENDLRQRMTKAFQPVDALTKQVLARASVNRVFSHEKALFDFDSKHITQPGNLKAIDYLERAYRSFGYSPELQWFTPTALQQTGGKTANIVATLKGTENPNLIYVVSSHFDSVAVGPGADDDTSGTAALLEAARILSATPLPATVVFASFTGEEAGLLGSTEWAETHADELRRKVVLYVNSDTNGRGFLRAAGRHSFQNLVSQVAVAGEGSQVQTNTSRPPAASSTVRWTASFSRSVR